MSAKLVIFIVLIALCKATLSQKVTSPIVGTNGGVAPLKLGNLEKEICQNDAILYQDCKYQKVVGTVNKKSGNLGFTHTKVWKAVAIEIPKGCKAVLYNELTHYGIHLKGPKKYCSKGVYNDGIHIVSLQDAADVEMVARELVTTENAFKMLEGKVERMSKMKGPKGDQGSKGDQGLKGEQGMPGPKGNKGDKGTKGDQGLKGVQGLKGIDGQKGDKGVQGLKGDKGIQGLKGEQGTPGLGLKYVTFALNKNFVKGDYVFSRSAKDAKHDSMFIAEKSFNSKNKKPYQDIGNWIEFSAPRGRDGEKGEKGDKGVQGDQGNIGPIGHTGPKGDQGIQGPKGDQGLKGDQGIQGPKGAQGLKGATGPKGDKGAQGLKGDRGSIGPRGLRGEIGAYTILNQTAKEGSSPSSRQRERGAKNSEDQTVGGSRERVFATAGGASSKAKNNETVDLDKNVTTSSSKDSKGNGTVDLDKNITTTDKLEEAETEAAKKRSSNTFTVTDYKTKRHDAIYEYHNYYCSQESGVKYDGSRLAQKDDLYERGKESELLSTVFNGESYKNVYKKNIKDVLMPLFGFTKHNAEEAQCISFGMQEAIAELIKVANEAKFSEELAWHCPNYYQDSDRFSDMYVPLVKNTFWWLTEHTQRMKRNLVPYAPHLVDLSRFEDTKKSWTATSTDYKNETVIKKGDCTRFRSSSEYPYSNGNMLQCFICAVESKLRTVTNKNNETKHHLQHALKIAGDTYVEYDECEQSMECTTKPKFNQVDDFTTKCRENKLNDNNANVICGNNCRINKDKCKLKNMYKKNVIFHKKSSSQTEAIALLELAKVQDTCIDTPGWNDERHDIYNEGCEDYKEKHCVNGVIKPGYGNIPTGNGAEKHCCGCGKQPGKNQPQFTEEKKQAAWIAYIAETKPKTKYRSTMEKFSKKYDKDDAIRKKEEEDEKEKGRKKAEKEKEKKVNDIAEAEEKRKKYETCLIKKETTDENNFCKRLMNMHGIAGDLKKFFTSAEYGKASTCEPTKHMNLYAENAVDVHVHTAANALMFKVSASNQKDIFLNAEDITFDKTKGIVTTVYDCTKDGKARDRCQKSLVYPACTTEETTNIITVSDNQGELSKCTVKVTGVKYDLECTEMKGSRRRRLLQSRGRSC